MATEKLGELLGDAKLALIAPSDTELESRGLHQGSLTSKYIVDTEEPQTRPHTINYQFNLITPGALLGLISVAGATNATYAFCDIV